MNAIKPCLIFGNYPLRTTDGGPSGFLAQNLLGNSSPYCHLGTSQRWQEPVGWRATWRRRIRREPGRTLRKAGLPRGSWFADLVVSARRIFECEHALAYDWIWFHDVWNMTACLDQIGAHQKVILQSHSPQLPSEEVADQGVRTTWHGPDCGTACFCQGGYMYPAERVCKDHLRSADFPGPTGRVPDERLSPAGATLLSRVDPSQATISTLAAGCRSRASTWFWSHSRTPIAPIPR